jgi:peroxiredoxin
VPSQGDFAAALDRIGGAQANMAAPPGIVAAQGGDLDAFVAAFRLGILEPVEIVGFRPAEGSPALVEVDLRAANGTATVGLDIVSRRPREIRLALGEGKQQVRASGRFRFTAGDPGAALAWPDLTGRKAVQSFGEMEARAYPLGQPAPDVTLRTLGGDKVRMADLRGSVVVLDFWATWCVPCWKALGHTAELAAWAKGSGLPVQVFALDTLETTEGPEEQRRQVTEFLRTKKLDLPVLLDSGKEAFSAFHAPGLPSLVIIGRDGRLARYHSGVLPDMVETVRGEVQELLK